MMNMLDTQEIREATQCAEEGKLFFLLVATPKKPPKTFHKKLIQPYLYARGWKKVSYQQTGFRALYFFNDQDDDSISNNLISTRRPKCARCKESGGENVDDENPPSKKSKENSPSKKSKENPKCQKLSANLTFCEDCEAWSSQERASFDRSCLKKEVEKFKQEHGGTFEVHIILSKPVDDGGEFMEIASQPGAVE